MGSCNWSGYSFNIYSMQTKWNDVGGVYIFSYLSDPEKRLWTAVYIGRTSSFSNRLPGHEKWLAAKRNGATHVHARSVSQETTRQEIEKELIQAFDPPLNR